jgi:hypothetical protein
MLRSVHWPNDYEQWIRWKETVLAYWRCLHSVCMEQLRNTMVEVAQNTQGIVTDVKVQDFSNTEQC